MILNNNVSGQGCSVSKNIVVPDFAIVSDVHTDHEEVSRTNSRCCSFATRSVNRAKFANEIIGADVEETFFVFELDVLRFAAEHGMFENSIARSQPGELFDYGVGGDITTISNFGIAFNNNVGPNPNVAP